MIKILYFASLAEQLNCYQEEFEIPSQDYTIKQLIEYLSSRNKQWQTAFNQTIICAVNQEMCHRKTIIKDLDEVAFYPPVTGG